MHFDQLLRVRGLAHEEENSFCAPVEGDGLSLLDDDGFFLDGLEHLIRTQGVDSPCAPHTDASDRWPHLAPRLTRSRRLHFLPSVFAVGTPRIGGGLIQNCASP